MSTTTASTHGPAPAPARHWADLPGPKAWPIVGSALQLQFDRVHIDFEQWAHEYGPVFKVRLGAMKVLVIRDHDVINDAMRDRPEGFSRPTSLARIVREMGLQSGLFTAEGEVWHAQRRMVMAAFSPSHVRAYFPLLLKVAQRLRGRWDKAMRAGQAIDLQADLMRFTVDAIAGLAFGAETNTLESDEDVIQQHLDKIFPALYRRLNALVPYWRLFKLPQDRDLDRSVAVVCEAIDGFIAQARRVMRDEPARAAHPTNLLEAMIAAADQEGSGVSDADVAGNVLTMLLAGEDTTANTLAWALYLLHRNPQAMARAREEAAQVVGRDLNGMTMDHMARLPYLEAVCHETMRLKPVAPFRVVQAVRETVVAGVTIPKDTMVWCVSRHDALADTYFPDAAAFQPERWLDADASGASSHAKRVSTPFGAGPRVCPGRYLALVEMKLALATLLSQFKVDAVDTPDGSEAREIMSFTMTPVGLSLRLSPVLP